MTLCFLYVKVPITHARERRRHIPLQHEVVSCACRKMYKHTEFRQACLKVGLLAGRPQATGRHCNRPSLFRISGRFLIMEHMTNWYQNSILNCLTIMQNSKCNTRIQPNTATAQLHSPAAIKTANITLLRFQVLYPASSPPLQAGKSDSP